MNISYFKNINLTVLVFISLTLQSQTNSELFEGQVLDTDSKAGLPYVSVFIKKNQAGTITNEQGTYQLDISNLSAIDTISFQFIGYKTKNITLEKLKFQKNISLETDVFTIDEVIISNKKIDPEDIVKNVLKNKEQNFYQKERKKEVFIRERYITDVNKIDLIYKKSTIEELNEEALKNFEKNTPKNSTSYFDFLGELYLNSTKKSTEIKMNPIKATELQSKDLAELDQYKKVFTELFSNTGEKEYWKIKSGIFGEKIDVSNETSKEKDTTYNDKIESRPLSYFKYQINEKSKYASLEDKDLWEFLHKTNRYEFTLEGTTTIHKESVYKISFTPKRKGLFEGTLYITTDTNALLKATYQYSAGKTGKDFNLFGVGYTESDFNGSIYFEKKDSLYSLKYFTFNKKYNIRIDRKIALQKKKDRFLFDKKLKELKIGLNLNLTIQEAMEYFSINSTTINPKTFEDYKEPENFDVIHIDQFDEKIWKGYHIIEPTKQLKTYKKLQ
ncbi:carboxypeptidase-like regulatory domain-containing protein [Flavicella marina]|uniref:carboxypeptidase-like regulatory domain-containing protein n=1 Tax=Flavicella marina TaxID=1475951 RepID=UPI00126438B3|nr:carboxypeptidase-like regulatory domain-containing protein [Flavicella marina]